MLRLALFSLALSLAACGGPTAQGGVSGLTLKSKGSGYPTVTGYVVNRGEVAIASADVAVTLYDADNRPLEDVMMAVRGVAVGDSVKFERDLDLPARRVKVKYLGVN